MKTPGLQCGFQCGTPAGLSFAPAHFLIP